MIIHKQTIKIYGKQSQVQVIDPPHTGHYNDSADLNKGFGAMMEMDDKHLIVSFQNGSQANPPDDTLRTRFGFYL